MSNPFDDPAGRFLVVVNPAGDHALWPVFATVPDGWETVFGADSPDRCLAYVEQNWIHLIPR